jgi:hypothetical protein
MRLEAREVNGVLTDDERRVLGGWGVADAQVPRSVVVDRGPCRDRQQVVFAASSMRSAVIVG